MESKVQGKCTFECIWQFEDFISRQIVNSQRLTGKGRWSVAKVGVGWKMAKGSVPPGGAEHLFHIFFNGQSMRKGS